MSVLMGVVGSFVAIIAFSVLLETPGKYLWQTGVVGAIGGGVYLLCTHRGVDVVPASFFSALAIAFMAHLFARIFKAPVTVFLIAGILPVSDCRNPADRAGGRNVQNCLFYRCQ